MNFMDAALILVSSALLLLSMKLALGRHIASNLRQTWPEDFKLVGSPRWSEVFWPGAIPGTFYWAMLARRYRLLPSNGSALSRYYLACTIVAWAHLVVASLFILLLLWQFILSPALTDIGSRA